ncbi:MAG: hypothetical protein CR968_03015 [Flavobacteriia bacterium]|nr:MAG: hypothetical protein CR968_03015 [Flavobacteriia bacterium]
MSSFKAVAIIDGKQRNLLRAEYTFYKLRDITGNPTTTARKTPIYLMFESTGFDDDLYYYMFSPTKSFSGEIIFYDRDLLKTLFKVEFHKAYVVGLEERFNHNDNLPLHINLAITCGAIKIRDVKKIEKWVPEDPFKEVAPTVLEQKNPQVLECYYTDLDGNKEAEPQTGEEVYVVLKTQDYIGETIDIDLSNHTKDFMYNGEIIKDDIIKDFEVTADTHKIKLKVVAQQPQPLKAS